MTVLSCVRIVPDVIKPYEPLLRVTKFRSGSHNVEQTISKFLAFHPRSGPHDFFKRTKNVDLSDVLTTFRPTHFNEVESFNRSASAGIMMKNQGFRKQGDVLDSPTAMFKVKSAIHKLKTGGKVAFHWFVCAASATYDIETDTTKVRPVWVPDFTLLYIEKMLVQDLWTRLDHKKRVPTPEKLCQYYCNGGTFLDYSSFDSQIPAWLLNIALTILFSYIDLSRYVGGNKPYSKNSLASLIKVVCSNFIYSRFKTPFNPNYRRKYHGVPSGSFLTHLVDTICSRLLLAYVGSFVPRHVATSYGDDSYINTFGYLDDQAVVSILKRLGFDVRVEPRNPTGHGIYCKAWCIYGKTFHTGTWFLNILNCLKHEKYWNLVIWALLRMYVPTYKQADQLTQLIRKDLPSSFSRDKVPFGILKLIDYSPGGGR